MRICWGVIIAAGMVNVAYGQITVQGYKTDCNFAPVSDGSSIVG